ncbi:e3 ubiquitin-protein ligase zswim2 : [Gemmata massiliana]|uniref:E3 ubiquitin-protein ligase zswim2 n=1 Tax=Gemmata massiliana TaxID=1210884 RepID=A0A6P2D155_9BACT|nr:hypothetical protein [Gemmata massiliana]VTR94853.1 e3 ubiquitin-protein ligase zswim2 : [Gemmata massiliana]
MENVKAPTRTIRLIRPPNTDGVGVFCLDIDGKCQFYTFLEIRCEIGGRGFAVHRLGQGELYHVRVGAPEDRSCECLGFLRWGRCKHVAGLAALIKKGELPTRL